MNLARLGTRKRLNNGPGHAAVGEEKCTVDGCGALEQRCGHSGGPFVVVNLPLSVTAWVRQRATARALGTRASDLEGGWEGGRR